MLLTRMTLYRRVLLGMLNVHQRAGMKGQNAACHESSVEKQYDVPGYQIQPTGTEAGDKRKGV